MSTTPPTSFPADVWRRWVRFWFAPTDPTTMAFLRIITGCVVVYVHLVYAYDLTAFFGKDAWYDLAAANRSRAEMPHRTPSFTWEHEEITPSAILPDGEGSRKAVAGWLRTLPADPAQLRRALRLVDTEGVLNPADRPDYPASGLQYGIAQLGVQYAHDLSPDPQVRATTLKALTKEIPRDKRETVPEPFDLMKPDQLKAFARDLEAFYATLPAGDRKAADRRAVSQYLFWLEPPARNNLLRFLADYAAGQPLADRREKAIDYLEYWGFEQRYADRFGQATFSLWFHVFEPAEMRVAHAAILVIMVMFTVGLWTRVTSVLTWLAAASFIHRNPQVLFGQDTMMNILLIYLMIANSGAALSLDRLIARYRAVRASLKRTGGIDTPTAAFLAAPPPSPSSGLAQRMLQVHFCFIYMAAGLSKLKGGSWWSADAVWQTVVNPEFTMIHFEWYQNLVRWALGSRGVYAVLAAAGVAHTLLIEIGLPFLVWTRLRPWMLIFAFLLHFNIGVFMGLLVFSLLMMTMLVSYIPGVVIRERLFGEPATDADKVKRPVKLTDEADCKKAAWAVAWDTRGRVELVPTR
jgi:hypothetical protein